jgi:hypothetical protein
MYKEGKELCKNRRYIGMYFCKSHIRADNMANLQYKYIMEKI